MKRLLIFLWLVPAFLSAQKTVVDGLLQKLANERTDSNKVKLMNEIALEYNLNNPAKGLIIAQQAYELAKKIHFYDGESRSLNFMANAYNITGNYNKAMEIYLKQLEIAEKRNLPAKLAGALMNIGILHTQQQDYRKAMPYYLRSDSIIRANHVTKNDIDYMSLLNLGDLYDRLNNIDSAFYFYDRSLVRAKAINKAYYIGASFIGLGNCYVKLKKNELGFENYHQALHYLQLANEEDLYCEAANDLAKLFDSENKKDSALHYAHLMLRIAQKDGFQSRMLDATTFLANFYKKEKKSDSAFTYLEKMTELKDSMSSREKIKDFQEKSFKEQIRQAEMAEQKRKDEAERSQQLQLLLIGIFIPVFFLLTLLLSKRKIHIRAIKVLGIVSLLLVFEYLTLLLHPFVIELTHHTPIYELMIFVSIAALLIPGHHRVEHWLIERLTHRHDHGTDAAIRIKKSKIKLKKPSP